MLPSTLAALSKLPAKDRIELALAELDRRLEEHLASPGSAIPWDEVRRKLARGA